MTKYLIDKNLCPSALMGLNSNPVITIIMIIMRNRGQSCGLCRADLEDLCLIFGIYGCMLLNSHWNQWDSFQQLPWPLAVALNGLLQQGKINIVVGSSSADDWIDKLKSLPTFPDRKWERPGVQRREAALLVNRQLHCSPLVTASGLQRSFRHPVFFTVWYSGCNDLDPDSCH